MPRNARSARNLIRTYATWRLGSDRFVPVTASVSEKAVFGYWAVMAGNEFWISSVVVFRRERWELKSHNQTMGQREVSINKEKRQNQKTSVSVPK